MSDISFTSACAPVFSFTSACAPVFLPINECNEINYDIIPQYFNYLYTNGIRSFFINGGCGEFSSITVKERKMVLEKWIEVTTEDVQIIVNIGTSNLADTVELGNHALSTNKIYCVAIVPPFYMPINNEENLLDYLISVASYLEKKIPILYYHIPSVSKVDFDINSFLYLVKQRQFHQLAAIKYTDSNFDNFLTFINGIKVNKLSINMYCGYDSLLSHAMDYGCKGAILGFVNMKPTIINSIVKNSSSDSNKLAMSTIVNIFKATISFSEEHKVNLVGLLKIVTEYYSNIHLGSMKKPYIVPQDKVSIYKKLISENSFSF